MAQSQLIDYEKAYLEEKAAKQKAEELLESKTKQLYAVNEMLMAQQEYLVQSEKMASIGQLAAGIAHEINNPIGFVLSNVNTLTGYLDKIIGLIKTYQEVESEVNNPELFQGIHTYYEANEIDYLIEDSGDLLNETKDGIERVKKIVAGLKTFAHSGEENMQKADVNEVIRAAIRLTQNETKYTCELEQHLGDIPEIFCYQDQLCQVLVNMITNAAHAIPNKGKITISSAADDTEVMIKIQDDGAGISEENISKLFNPFFTTKAVGKGTGLGLSISYGIIVEKHKGRIDVDSELGKGTTFTIHIPKKEEEAR